MEKTIGLAEAKARLSELVDRAQAGETITILRKGSPAAELRPVHRVSPTDALRRLEAIRRRIAKRNAGKQPWPRRGERMRDVIHAGHRP